MRASTVAALGLSAVVVGVAIGWVAARGLPWQESDAERAEAVLTPFVEALRRGNYAKGCGLLAASAPPLRDGAAACASRLRRAAGGRSEWASQLRTIEVRVDDHEGARLYVRAFERAGFLDSVPVYRFTLLREDGSLHIEHLDGRF